MKHISEYTDRYLNGLIVNDGWAAFLSGQPESDCPYPDDPTAAEKWRHGYKEAENYHEWKNKWINEKG